MIGLNRFRILLSVLPVAALLACSEQESVGPAAPEENELAVSAYATTWKIADYWCMDFDGDKGTMKLKMSTAAITKSDYVNQVTGTVDWKRRADATLAGGQVIRFTDPYYARIFGEMFDFRLRTGTSISDRLFRAERNKGSANFLKGSSWNPSPRIPGNENIKPWSATRGACQ